MRGSEAVVRMLQQLGVDVLFGLCGDTSLPLYESLYDLDHGICAASGCTVACAAATIDF